MNTEFLAGYVKFLNDDIECARKEIEGIAEDSRIHVQKLIYTNIIDRFDVVVDKTILENIDNQMIYDEAIKNLKDNVLESELIRAVLLGDGGKVWAKERIQNAIRYSVLRNRHSLKLGFMFRAFLPNEKHDKKPRVNPSTGAIFESIKIAKGKDKVPQSICGYADWNYSRRNAMIHGSGKNKLLQNDLDQLSKIYGVKPAQDFKIRFGSISIAMTFYKTLTELFLNGISA